MAAIQGLERMSDEELHLELQRGGRFVFYPFCISILVMSFRRSSSVRFLKAGDGDWGSRLGFAALSLALGWWGFPWGFIWTPICLWQTLSGGKDITAQVVGATNKSV
jgi:hypothetical protein